MGSVTNDILLPIALVVFSAWDTIYFLISLMSLLLLLAQLASVFDETKKFWGQDAIKGSRKKLKIFISSWHGSRVWHCYGYLERQFKNAYFQPDSDQTQKPCQNFFFKAKISIEVSKVSKQLQDKQTEENFTNLCKWLFYQEFILGMCNLCLPNMVSSKSAIIKQLLRGKKCIDKYMFKKMTSIHTYIPIYWCFDV